MDERVLLVEEDASIRVVGIGLRQSGMRPSGVADGRDALAQFREPTYDVVLLDVMLPSLDSFEVLREIRRQSRVPVVMLTARTETVDVVVGLELGADDYVTTPRPLPASGADSVRRCPTEWRAHSSGRLAERLGARRIECPAPGATRLM